MPTLAEIMAARKSGTQGKAQPAASGGITITPESERAALAAEVKQTLDACAPVSATAPKTPPLTPRELGAMEAGERLPMDHPQADCSPMEIAWFSACHSFATTLCIIIEPGETSQHAWIACRQNPQAPPIFLYRLPLWIPHPSNGDPF